MLWLHACHRCGGDLTEDGISHETYVICLQCGTILTMDQELALRAVGRRRQVTSGAA